MPWWQRGTAGATATTAAVAAAAARGWMPRMAGETVTLAMPEGEGKQSPSEVALKG